MAKTESGHRRSWLDRVERLGNKLPDPSTLFVVGALLVMVLSQVAVLADWKVQPLQPTPVVRPLLDAQGQPIIDGATGKAMTEPVLDARGRPEMRLEAQMKPVTGEDGEQVLDPVTGEPVMQPAVEEAVGLLSADGIYWALSSMVQNFINFPPLGVVLVGMLGIGIAERTGLIGALLKAFMRIVPSALLTPAMVFLGIMSSLATDAGYIVLPPLAMALYKAVGRSPLVGLAAVFAGVSAGFNANLLITGLDPMLAELSTLGARVVDPLYAVAPTCNWWFMIASTFVITLVGWGVTSKLVEPRLRDKPADEGGPAPVTEEDLEAQRMTAIERKGLVAAGIALLIVLGLVIAMTLVPNWPLHGEGARFARWVEAIVPIIFFSFLIPGMAYGFTTKALKSEKDVAKTLIDSMAYMAPIIVLAFFAAQFIAYFNHSNLGKMLAMSGGQALATAQLSPAILVAVFILVTLVFNLFIGSMSAKYALFAPIFIPMFMLVGISPELTQAAYRIGDSVSNVITPLNSYLIIILVFMRKYVPNAGMGTLVSTMLPYTIVFTVVWTIMLILWMQLGFPLGVEGPLEYIPGGPGRAVPQ
jgi:aminobenzoyl-glutamate transport protein